MLTKYYSGDHIQKNWMKHVAQMPERRVERVLFGKPKGRDHLEDPGLNGSLILRLIFRKWNNPCWLSIINFHAYILKFSIFMCSA